MKHIRCRHAAVLLSGVLSAGAAQAQTIKAQDGAKSDAPIPAITDWSSRSVIYGKAKLPEEFARGAAGDAEMARKYRDPRYVAQVLRRIDSEMPMLRGASQSQVLATRSANATAACKDRRRGHCPTEPTTPDSQEDGSVLRDWSNVLGGGTDGQGGGGMEGVFPAKYNFNITAAPSCTNDFVVYPTNAPGATQSGTRQEQWSGNVSGNFTAGQFVTIGLPGPRQVTLTASGSDNTGRNFQTATDNNARATNLRDAINRWSGQTGFSATGTGATVTIISNSAGDIDNSSIASTLGNIALNRTYPGTGTTSAGQPTIIAFNQLYNDICNVTTGRDAANAAKTPNVMWSYNTGTGSVVETSPVLSWHDDGAQVAFVQRNGNTLQLVLLKPAALTTSAARLAAAANPTALTPQPTAAAYKTARTGAAAAMYVIPLNASIPNNTGSTPTYSAPFVDYAADILWVGDGNGRLHKFTGVFKDEPAEVTTGGFPVTVATGMKLSSPVQYDGNVYIGSQSGAGDLGGKLHRISASDGSKFDSVKLANVDSTGLRESVIVTDTPVGSGSVFGFLFNDGTGGNTTDCAPTSSAGGDQSACRVVARFAPGFAADAQPAQRAYVGRGNSRVSTLYAGAFDDAYYTSATGTGAMYIVGGDPLDTFVPTLWKISLTNGAMTSQQKGPVVGINDCNNVGDCITNRWNWSPVTYAKQGSNEFIYYSMPYKGNQTGCSDACLYMYQLNNLRNGTVEQWTVQIARGASSGFFGTRQGISNTTTAGNLTVNNVALLPGTHFSPAGTRPQDRTALVTAINAYTGYSAVETGDCTNDTSSLCAITITSNVPGNLAGTLVAANGLDNVSVPGNANGSAGNLVGWGTTANANASLPAPGGTGGIVIDNNSGTPGAAQIYFTQQVTGGNAIQASQSGLE